MSFEEPKAPIVRIRRKRTKRKSKDNDIVHLPVRASRQTRYSSLTTPTNPQTKSRECCRHIFASCFKIPVCRMLCFRCILPPCYNGEGSDDDDTNDVDTRDEGYHSQNRHSTEALPTVSSSDGCSGNPQAIEMTEVKQESVIFIPPPRNIPKDYRKDVSNSRNAGKSNGSVKGAIGGQYGDSEECGEVTYIEVESISLSDADRDGIPNAEAFSDAVLTVRLPDSDGVERDFLEAGYEEPIQTCVSEMDLADEIEKVLASKCEQMHKQADDYANDNAGDTSEYVECDNEDFCDESQHYVNESILHAKPDSQDNELKPTTKSARNADSVGATYANLTSEKEVNPHSDKINTQNGACPGVDSSRDYINVPSTEADSHPSGDIVVEGMVNTLKDDIESLKLKCANSKAKVLAEKSGNTERKITDQIDKTSITILRSNSNSKQEEEKEHVVNVADTEQLLKVEKCNKDSHSDGDTDNERPNTEVDESTDQTNLI